MTADGQAFNYPTAEYALLDVVHGEPNLTFRRVPYDVEAHIASFRESGMPFQDRMLEDFVPLKPARP